MAGYQVENVTFYYPRTSTPALQGIDLSVRPGDFILIGGPTGSGKTTLLRLLKKQVQPAGKLTGSILYGGISLQKMPDKASAEEIGMVFQNPDNQIIMNTVRQELCYGMENLGYPAALMQKRMAEVVPFFGMDSWLHQSVETLSGGQKQLLNLAAVMMLRPRVLLLDEPTAQLDPIAASEFTDLLVRINQELSITVILCEHRLEGLFSHANRVLLMREGRIAYQGKTDEVIRRVWEEQDIDFSLYLPSVSRLYLQMEEEIQPHRHIPVTVKAGKRWFSRYFQQHGDLFSNSPKAERPITGDPERALLHCHDLYFQYGKKTAPVLKRLSCLLKPQDFFVLLGGNGAGKSTLLKLVAGVLDHQRGNIRYKGTKLHRMPPETLRREIGYVAQNPLAYFTRDTVQEQLEERAEALGVTETGMLVEIIRWFQLEPVMAKHPFDISGGQQQKLVLALVLMADPELILMDEPTKGLDPVAKRDLARWLNRIREKGKTIFMVSHDIEFAAAHASQCGLLFDGSIIAVDHPAAFFSENYYYTTMIHRMVRENLSEEVTEEGVITRWSRSGKPSTGEA